MNLPFLFGAQFADAPGELQMILGYSGTSTCDEQPWLMAPGAKLSWFEEFAPGEGYELAAGGSGHRRRMSSAAVVADHGPGLVEPAEQRPVQDMVDAADGGEQGAGEQTADLGQ